MPPLNMHNYIQLIMTNWLEFQRGNECEGRMGREQVESNLQIGELKEFCIFII